ncbi:MAG TPA: ComEC/Rec2 family competence protein [Chthoniobacterales bacterium]|jgi:ComEC/Rec2-related protein
MKPACSPRQPLLGVALSASGGILLAEFVKAPLLILCLTIALISLVAVLWPRIWLTYLLVVSGFFSLHLRQQSDSPGRGLATRIGGRARQVTVTGMTASEPKVAPNEYATFDLQLETIDLEGRREACRAIVRVRCKLMPQFGDELRLRGTIEPIPPARNPGGFDLCAYLARRDIYLGIFARYPEDVSILQIGGGNVVRRMATRARRWMRATLNRGLEDSPEVTALIDGMALGIRHDAPNDIEEPFQQTGTLHLFAVAGLHVGIVAQLLWILASLLRLPRTIAAAAIIPCLYFYSAVTGFHVSSVRAATMAAFLLGGIFFDRPMLAINSLAGAAVVILACDTNQLFTSGFQLSFAVVGAILIFRDRLFRGLLRPAETDPFLPRSLVSRGRRTLEQTYRWLASGIAVSSAAWIGSLLFIIWYFYLITPISLLANLFIVPVAFCVLAVVLMSLLAAAFSAGLLLIFNNANWSLAKLILGLVQVLAHLPCGHAYVERPHWPSGARAEITVLDAGGGAAVHLRSDGCDWLFDCASARDYQNMLRDYLHARGINRLDGLMLSHGDARHIGGARLVIEDFNPRRVIDNAAPDRSSVHHALFVNPKNRELAIRGKTFTLSRGVKARVLYPAAGIRALAADDAALVVQLIINNRHRVLLVSDSGPVTERALLAQPNDLQSDILIKGQHYTGQSGSLAFLEAVRPQLIVATSVDFPTRERIPDDWAKMVQERGIKLFRQDETGAVQLEFFRDDWRATSFLGHEILRRSSR